MTGLRRALVAVSGTAVLLVALGGFAHTPLGRPLLALAGKCPVVLPGSLPADQREAGRAEAIKRLRGTAPAASRLALGFSLGATRRAEVDAWAAEQRLRCEPTKSGSTLACHDVPVALLPERFRGAPVDELTFRFDAANVLVAVVTRRAQLEPKVAYETQRDIAGAVDAAAGPSFSKTGDEKTLEVATAFSQVRNEWRFRDYYASCTASRIHQGVTLYEEYMLIPD